MPRVANDVAALVLRVSAGLIFLPHGWTKVAGEGGAGVFAGDMAANYGIPAVLGHVAAWAEVAGAVLLILGLFVRLHTLLLAGVMFVAAFVVQLPDALYEVPPGSIKLFVGVLGIELPLAMFAISVSLLLTGAGRVSLDHLLGIERRVAAAFGKKKAAAGTAAAEV